MGNAAFARPKTQELFVAVYATDTVDEMDHNPTVDEAAETVKEAAPPPSMKENESSNRKWKILLFTTCAILLLVLGCGVALSLKYHLAEPDDCDVGPWERWTSRYLPPGTCGIGSKNRTRKKRVDAKYKGEKCAELRIIELAALHSGLQVQYIRHIWYTTHRDTI